jgi:CBS-domain-containing membrane protein
MHDRASIDDRRRRLDQLMADRQVRRIPVVDTSGTICGIVAQADLEATDARSLKAMVAERVATPH